MATQAPLQTQINEEEEVQMVAGSAVMAMAMTVTSSIDREEGVIICKEMDSEVVVATDEMTEETLKKVVKKRARDRGAITKPTSSQSSMPLITRTSQASTSIENKTDRFSTT